MTLTLDTNSRYGQLNFDPSYSSSASPPQFSDPWSTAPAPNPGSNLYVSGNSNHQQPQPHPHHQGLSPEMGLNLARQQAARQSTSSVSSSASYGSMPVTTTSTGNHSYFRSCRPYQPYLPLDRLSSPQSAAQCLRAAVWRRSVLGHFVAGARALPSLQRPVRPPRLCVYFHEVKLRDAPWAGPFQEILSTVSAILSSRGSISLAADMTGTGTSRTRSDVVTQRP